MNLEHNITERLRHTREAMVSLARALKLAGEACTTLVAAHDEPLVLAGAGVCAARLRVLVDAVHAEVHRQQEAIAAASSEVFGPPPSDAS